MAARRPWFAAAAALVGLGLVPVMAAPATSSQALPADVTGADWAGRRLVANADFEQSATDGTPAYAAPGWTAAHPGTFVAVETQDVEHGKQALSVRNVHDDRQESAESEPIAVLPGETLTVSAWAKHTSGAPGVMTLQFWNADGSRIDRDYGRASSSAADTNAWTTVTASRIAPEDAVRMTIVLASNGVGETLWDDIEVSSTAPSAYQVPDGGFEDTRDDQLHTHWTYSGQVSKQGDDVWANDRALSVTGTADVQSRATSFLIPVVAGDRLTATVWAKVAAGAPGTFSVEFLAVDRSIVEGSPADYRKTPVGTPSSTTADGPASWHQLSLTADVPAGATHVQLTLASSGAGTTYWDDARVAAPSDADLTAYRSELGDGSVLFVGDQKVEGYAGLSRVVHPGTKTGADDLADLGQGVVLGHPGTADSRTVSAVLKDPDGPYRMWFAGSKAGYLESADGIHWDDSTATPTVDAPTDILENPRYGQAGQPKYFGLAIGFADDPDVRKRTQNYYVYVSDDGITWTRPTPNIPAIHGRDTAMVSWDPVRQRFVATVKQWYMTTASPGTYRWEPRSAWVSFSDDFTTWTEPRLVLQSDVRDYTTVTADHPDKQTTSDIYSLPTFRYGEQVLGLPWMQDVTNISRIVNMGQDVSTEHIELASSQDYFSWSRPARDPIIAKGAPAEWDWGFTMTATSGLITEGDTVRMYYGSYAGEHACTAARIQAGACDVLQVPSRIGMVTWKRDRFVSLHSNGSGPGVVTTRVLAPAAVGGQVHLNASGTVRVEVLDATGRPIPGYGLQDSVPVRGDNLDAVATWRGADHLPSGVAGLRLRLQVTGDVYSYAIK
jgi:Carbohydrate binding domain